MITKEEASKLAELVRTAPSESEQSILWAVRYHVALFFWGIQSAEQTLEALLLAANTGRPDHIVERIGLSRLQELRGNALVEIGYGGNNFIRTDKSETSNDL